MNIIEFFKQKRLFLLGVAIAILVAFFDILTKRIIFSIIENHDVKYNNMIFYIHVTDFFNLVRVWNKGVSFGMFNNFEYSKILFSVIVSVIVLVLLLWLYRNKEIYLSIAIGLIIGGALGNLCDRIKYGAVADFLDFHIDKYHWPAFNLADSCVFIGVAMLILEDLFFKKRLKK